MVLVTGEFGNGHAIQGVDEIAFNVSRPVPVFIGDGKLTIGQKENLYINCSGESSQEPGLKIQALGSRMATIAATPPSKVPMALTAAQFHLAIGTSA